MSIFGIKREPSVDKRKQAEMSSEARAKWEQPVRKLRAKQALESLKRRRKEEELERKREMMSTEASFYKAKAERKEAKERAGRRWGALPTFKVKVKKKKQGRKLNSKRRIGL